MYCSLFTASNQKLVKECYNAIPSLKVTQSVKNMCCCRSDGHEVQYLVKHFRVSSHFEARRGDWRVLVSRRQALHLVRSTISLSVNAFNFCTLFYLLHISPREVLSSLGTASGH